MIVDMVKIILIIGMVFLILAMFKITVRIPVRRLKKKNLGAPFVIGFQMLLLVCAGLLTQGDSGLANEIAVYAYYLLVVGVVLQLVSFVGQEENDEE
ncbi:MAG: hypothetical protein ACE5R6_21230 [Candidatus Heimdallarchaeota archaeon]